MSFNTNWDVDNYKTEHESDEHWELRRRFMVANKNKFPEERLVCLAQVFTNIEFLGCRYPQETMELVEELSEGVADEYRENQKSKLQRTFVKASDAAGAKVKGLKRPLGDDATGPSDSPPKIPKRIDNAQLPQNTTPATLTANMTPCNSLSSDSLNKNLDVKGAVNSNSEGSQGIKTCAFVRATEVPKITLEDKINQECNNHKINESEDNSICKAVFDDDQKARKEARINHKSNRKLKKGISGMENYRDLDSEMGLINTEKFGRLILLEGVEDNKHNILRRSTTHCNIPFQIQYEEKKPWEPYCKVFVNNHLLTTSCGFNKKEARTLAIDEAYEKLKQICYVLKIKTKIDSNHTVVEKNEPLDNDHTQDKLNQPLEDNIGSKLMRAMGWTGGGLGKEQQGMKEPIRVELKVNRTGLGLKDSKVGRQVFEAKISDYLRDYAKQQGEAHDLVFSSEFTKDERAFMHSVCQRLGLKSKSYGKGDDRRLVVSYRKDFCNIVEDMLRSGEYSTLGYELIKPPISLPPENEPQTNPDCESQVKSESTVVNPAESQCLNASGDLRVPNIAELSLENENSPVAGKSSGLPMQGIGEVPHQRQNSNELTGPFGPLVLIEDEAVVTPIQIIERSANACHIPFKFEYANTRGGMICKLFMNNVLVTSSTEFSKKQAREVTVKNGITKLKEVCYSLKIQNKMKDKTFNVIKSLTKPNRKQLGIGNDKGANIVCVSKEVDWPLLGISKGGRGASQLALKNSVKNFLRNYQAEICPYDLTIPPDFPTEMSSFFQKTASGLALKTVKLLENNFVVISKKLSIIELAKAMLTSGGNTSDASM